VGLHHVTAIASDPQRNLDFYTLIRGLFGVTLLEHRATNGGHPVLRKCGGLSQNRRGRESRRYAKRPHTISSEEIEWQEAN
jgi:catechol 2,3-dioxygenase-like lactoylglutathione lyase family enzyme